MASMALAFDILARDKASKVLDGIGDKADKTGGRLSKLGETAKFALGGAALGGIAAFGAGLVQGGKDAVAFETLALKTEAVIKSTGNVANISVGGIQKLAGSLESLSGVDEELIINSQNVLATFTQIRNVGDAKIFDKATESALNMSVALGQDLQSSTIMVGKALNDPIKGVTALGKAGVQFTTKQKEQIKWLVANNRTLDAQKIILGELETQFGGTAKAAGSGLAGSMARVQDVIGDTFRTIATAALPTLTNLAEGLADKLPGAIATAQRWFATIASVIQDDVVPVMSDLRDGAAKVFEFLKENQPVLIGISTAIGVGLVAAFTSWAVSAGAAAVATIAALAPFIAIGAAIAGVTAAVVWAYQNVDVFRKAVDTVARFLTGTVWPAIQTGARLFTDKLVPAIQRVIEFYWNFYSAVFEVVGKVVSKMGEIVSFFVGLPGKLARVAGDVFGFLRDSFKSAVNFIIRGWNSLDFKIPGFDPPGPGPKFGGFTLGVPDITELHTGGTVTARGIAPLRSDEVLARLQLGETVVPRAGLGGGSRGDVIFNVSEAPKYNERTLLDYAAWQLAGI